MDITERKITKIAREAEKLVLLTMREEGVGTAEIDLIHAVRHHPGCTQAQLAELPAFLRAGDCARAAAGRRTSTRPRSPPVTSTSPACCHAPRATRQRWPSRYGRSWG